MMRSVQQRLYVVDSVHLSHNSLDQGALGGCFRLSRSDNSFLRFSLLILLSFLPLLLTSSSLSSLAGYFVSLGHGRPSCVWEVQEHGQGRSCP
eukprot:1499308-Amphidinium_carterae.1